MADLGFIGVDGHILADQELLAAQLLDLGPLQQLHALSISAIVAGRGDARGAHGDNLSCERTITRRERIVAFRGEADEVPRHDDGGN